MLFIISFVVVQCHPAVRDIRDLIQSGCFCCTSFVSVVLHNAKSRCCSVDVFF